ncbi:MAG: hypothetical protein IH600_11650, partial [Bacteroidetes bacterium]|nr:hypothetical protein [Bacteroidota bacterium]
MQSTFVTLTMRIRFEAKLRIALLLFSALALLLPCAAAAQGSWQAITPPAGAQLMQIAQVDDTLMCFDDDGIFMRSEDGGGNWSECPVRHEKGDGSSFLMYAAFDRFWMISTRNDSLYFYDRDFGWIGNALPSSIWRVYQVWALGDTVLLYSNGGLFISTDPAGLWWSDFGQGLPPGLVSALSLMQTESETALLCAAGGKGLFRRDAGTVWQFVSNAPETQKLKQLIHTGFAFLGLLQQENIVVKSATGMQWDTLSIGSAAWISQLAMDGPIVYAASYHGLYTSKDSLQTWEYEPFTAPGLNVACIDAHDGHIAVVTMNGGVYVSADAGKTWKHSDIGSMKIGSVLELDGELIVGHPMLESYFRYSGDRWIWIPVPSEPDPQLYWVHTMFAHSGWLYYQRRVPGTQYSRIWRSSDKGRKWEANDSLQLLGRPHFAVADNWIFMSDVGVYRTNDAGATWELRVAGSSFPGQPAYVEHIAALPGHLYAAGSCWFGHSTDAGDTWQGDTLGLPGSGITGLMVS